MNNWSGNGMEVGDEDDILDAIGVLGLMPAEIKALAESARFEADVARDMAAAGARGVASIDAELWTRISGWWRRRSLKWKEIEAAMDLELERSDHDG